MMIQTAPEGAPRFAILMDEHTALAAQFARAFGNERFEHVQPREPMLYVIEHHDKGWASYDAAPETDARTGLPYNLVDTPAEDITRTSTASPDFNEKKHPYCGLLSSMHSWGLYNGRYGLSDKVLIDSIPAAERHLADRMLEAELRRQERLKAELAKDPEAKAWIEQGHVFQNYKQLQFFDTFALYFNRTHEEARSEASFAHVPMNATHDATIRIRPVGPATYAVSPYPFGEAPGRFFFLRPLYRAREARRAEGLGRSARAHPAKGAALQARAGLAGRASAGKERDVRGYDLPALSGAHPGLALTPDLGRAMREVLGVRNAEVAPEGDEPSIAQRAALIHRPALAAEPRDLGVAVEQLGYTVAQRQVALPEQAVQSLDVVCEERLFIGVKGARELGEGLRFVDLEHEVFR